MIRNPGNTVITVEFTRKGTAPVATAWDMEEATRVLLRAFGREFDLISAQVTGTREEPGTVTLTAAEYNELQYRARSADASDTNDTNDTSDTSETAPAE
jgi:hypothetical protein